MLAAKRTAVWSLLVCLVSTAGLAQFAFDAVEVAKSVSPAVVRISGVTEQGAATGSGFIITSDGKIATSLHVIQEFESGRVELMNGEQFDSFTVVAADARRDLAIIQITGFDLPTVSLGNSNQVSPGEPVLIIGNPTPGGSGALDLRGTITSGLVSAVRVLPEGVKVIQTDAAVNPGNSGGPLVNSRGEAVGVGGFKIRAAENLNFAVPINYVRAMLNEARTPMSLSALKDELSSRSALTDRGESPTPKAASGDVLFVARRTGSHYRRSSHEIFRRVVDEVILFLDAEGVDLINDDFGGVMRVSRAEQN